MKRRRNGHRVNGFTMDDLARGDLVGDNSDEPRLTLDDAVRMLAASCSLEQTESVLSLVRRQDRRRLIKRADARRDRLTQVTERALWVDEPLSFGREVEF